MPPMIMYHHGAQFVHIDAITSTIIVLSSLIIYVLTRDLYLLSGHKGIKFFRTAFLFFSISFLLPLLFPLLQYFPPITALLTIALLSLITVYTGTMAVFCLLYGVTSKKLELKYPLLTLNTLAIVITLITVFVEMLILSILLQIIVFAIAAIIASRKQKKRAFTQVLYGLLFVAWLSNVVANYTAGLSILLTLLLNLLSAALFLTILFRVLSQIRKPIR